MTGGSRLNHSLCNLIEAMWIVILEQYELSTDKLPTKVPLKIQPVPLERGNKQLNLTNPNFFKEKPLGNCPLFSDTCHYEKQTTKMFKNGMYVKKKSESHESRVFPWLSKSRSARKVFGTLYSSNPVGDLIRLRSMLIILSYLSHSFTKLKFTFLICQEARRNAFLALLKR